MPKGILGRRICKHGCVGKRVAGLGLCDKHYKRWKRKHVKGYRKRETLLRRAWVSRHRKHSRIVQNACNLRLRQRDKELCFLAYGGYLCVCCGETIPLLLTLDHIKGGGRKHRRKTKGHLYRWVVKHNFPEGMFQVLCWSCNAGKHFNSGVCPHEEIQHGKKRPISSG